MQQENRQQKPKVKAGGWSVMLQRVPNAQAIGVSRNWLTLLLAFLSRVRWIHLLINDFLINLVTSSAPARPSPYSLWSRSSGKPPAPEPQPAYVSWPGLVDRSYTGRHLPECTAELTNSLPPLEALEPLFRRGPAMKPCAKSSALLCFFAQWFTDSFLRTDPDDFRKNTSNHEIDLCQIYGLTDSDTHLLRLHQGGLLKSTGAGSNEYPVRLFDSAGERAAGDFSRLGYINPTTGRFRHDVLTEMFDTPERRRGLYAAGLERGNSTIVYSALNTLFLREHNRLAREIAATNRTYDDDRVFEHARNANIVQLLKVIIEDYINHLSSTPVRFLVDVGKAERRTWYRTNRISAEFNLLYRWHPLTPDAFKLGGETLPHEKFRYNNELLESHGVAATLGEASQQAAGSISLRNTPQFLVHADLSAVSKSRGWRMRGYNDYREAFGLRRLTSIRQLVKGDETLEELLTKLYRDIDRVELLVGLFAEAKGPADVLGELMRIMVGVDAFSQALTNPLLSSRVFGEQAFTSAGLESVEQTSSLNDIARRHDGSAAPLSFCRP